MMIRDMQSRATWIDIDLAALAHNFRMVQKHVGNTDLMPIIKGNAYGHGMVRCAAHLQEIGAKYLGVALLEEGIALRHAGISIPIVVLGGVLGHQIEHFIHHNLDIMAASVSKLEAIEQQAAKMGKQARVHLEIDTGMERTGVHYYTAHTLIAKAAQMKHCNIVGVASHFADCEIPDLTLTKLQLQRFLDATSLFSTYGLDVPIRHIAASGAILQLTDSHLDMVRPGLILYGISPAPHLQHVLDLRPVMSLKSRIVYFKVVKQGAGVSYGHLWKAPQDTRIVTVPFGYGDGYSRELAKGASVLIRGKRYPIVGRMCMDQFMVDIGQDEAFNGDEVVVIGRQGNEAISVEELTNRLPAANAREITTAFNLRIPRFYQ